MVVLACYSGVNYLLELYFWLILGALTLISITIYFGRPKDSQYQKDIEMEIFEGNIEELESNQPNYNHDTKNKEIKEELNEVRRALALNQADTLAETAQNGLVITEVTGVDQEGLRELATAIASKVGVKAVVLGLAPESGGAALVSIVTPDSGLDAGALVSESAKTIGGGGRLNPDLTVIGGRQPENLQEALDQARDAAEMA